jgi:hypothetical protein
LAALHQRHSQGSPRRCNERTLLTTPHEEKAPQVIGVPAWAVPAGIAPAGETADLQASLALDVHAILAHSRMLALDGQAVSRSPPAPTGRSRDRREPADRGTTLSDEAPQREHSQSRLTRRFLTRMAVQSRENGCSVCRVAKPAPAFAQDHCATATVDLVPIATLKGPRLAPGTRLKIDLEDHGVFGVSGQQPHSIFRPERASPQGYQGLS